jgi:hypothetical protein
VGLTVISFFFVFQAKEADMIVNGKWWNITETEEGTIAQSGPYTEFFDFSVGIEEIYHHLQEWY